MLSSRNFATMATWRIDFSSLFFTHFLFVFKAGHLLTRNHGEAKDTPPQFPLIQNQCIDLERFKPLFECLTNWGTGEIGPILAKRAFKVSKNWYILLWEVLYPVKCSSTQTILFSNLMFKTTFLDIYIILSYKVPGLKVTLVYRVIIGIIRTYTRPGNIYKLSARQFDLLGETFAWLRWPRKMAIPSSRRRRKNIVLI